MDSRLERGDSVGTTLCSAPGARARKERNEAGGKGKPGLVNLYENIFTRVMGHETSVPSLACNLSMCERKSL